MKKHLLAVAVAAAVTAPAMAQNVTVYGRLDAGYSTFKTNASAGDNAGIGYNADSTSRIGLMGSEDLGGGLKASFVLEGSAAGGTTMNTTNAGAASTAGQGTSFGGFQRAQFVALAGSFGEIRVGLKNSLTKDIIDGYNVGGASNIEGKLSDAVLTAGTASRDHGVGYTSPTMSGFTFKAVATSLKDDGDNTGTGNEVGVNYKAGNLDVALATRSVKNTTTYKTKQQSMGAIYNAGFASFVTSYTSIEKEAASAIKDEATEFGLRVPVGNANLFVSFANGDSTTGTSSPVDVEAQQFGVRYTLSKRTYAYAITGKSKIGTVEESNTGVGIVHSF